MSILVCVCMRCLAWAWADSQASPQQDRYRNILRATFVTTVSPAQFAHKLCTLSGCLPSQVCVVSLSMLAICSFDSFIHLPLAFPHHYVPSFLFRPDRYLDILTWNYPPACFLCDTLNNSTKTPLGTSSSQCR